MGFRFFEIAVRFHLAIGIFFVHSSKLFIHSLSEWFSITKKSQTPILGIRL